MMDYEVLTHLEEVDKTLAFVYRELCYLADNVNREMNDLAKMAQDNREKFEKGLHLFYQRSTASQSADFERECAKYEIVESIFRTGWHVNSLDPEEVDRLVDLARKAR